MSETSVTTIPPPDPAARLWQLWQQGQRPDVRQFLAMAGALSPDQILAVLWIDRQQRWLSGDRIPAERYLEWFPALRDDSEKAVELVYGEFLVREELAENPSPEDFLHRFPALARRLQEQIDLHKALTSEADADPNGAISSGPRTQPFAAPEPLGWPQVPGLEIVRELGRGGMGIVYQAWQQRLKRLVALKLVRSGSYADESERARFSTEVEAIARLQHPHIVQIYDVGEHAGQPYFTMEFVDGGSLAQKLRGDPRSPDQAAELVETLSQAMHYAHGRGIVHRDLKPANVLLRPDGTPKITDFGLAKLVVGGGTDQTETGVVMGTAAYMAPEQAGGKGKAATAATDVYALGVILYELLTGRTPFRGETTLDTLQQVLFQEPVAPRRLQPKLSRDLETICLKCLEKAPRRRYGSASELAEDLRRAREGVPIHARPVGAWERAAKWVRRRPALAAAIFVPITILIGSIVGSLIHLNIALNDARKDWKFEAERAQRLERRTEGQDFLLRAEAAAQAGDWQSATFQVAEALRRIEETEDPSGLHKRATDLQYQAEQQLADRAHLRQFEKYYHDAQSRWGLVFDRASPNDLKQIRTAARAALVEFGIQPEAGDAPVLSASYTPEEKTAIVAGCYELLLMLADVAALPQPEPKGEAIPEQTGRAAQILQRAARLGPVTQAYYYRLAKYLQRLGDETGARNAASQAAATPPAGPLDCFLAGQEQYRSGQIGPAREGFERALLAQPNHFWARYFLALCHLRLHQNDAAVAGFTACLGQKRDFVWLYVLRALANTERNELAAAEADFRTALALQPDRDARYGVHINRANLRLRQGRTEDAITDLNEAIPLKPNHYQAHLNLAHIDRQRKDWKAAEQQLKLAFEKSADPIAELFRTRAQIALDREDFKAAQTDFRLAVEHETSNPANRANDHVELGRLLQRSQEHSKALKEFEAALHESPDHLAALRGLGESLVELKRYEEAVQALERHLKPEAAPVELCQLRGFARTMSRDYRGAVEDYTFVIRREPTAALLARRGWLYLLTDAFRLARQDFEDALQLGPATGDMYAGRGFACAQLGQTEQAIKDARQALRLGPDEPALLVKVAGIYSQALARLNGTSTGRERALFLDCQQEALKLMYRALDQFTAEQQPRFWKETIYPDKALDPLRLSSKDFRNLESAQALRLPR